MSLRPLMSTDLLCERIGFSEPYSVFKELSEDEILLQIQSHDISGRTSELIRGVLGTESRDNRLFKFLETFDQDALYELARSDLLEALQIPIPDTCPVKSAKEWCYYILGRKKGIFKKWEDVPNGDMVPCIRLIDMICGGEPIDSADSITDADIAFIEALPKNQKTMIWLRIIEVNPTLEENIVQRISHGIIPELEGNQHLIPDIRAEHTLLDLRKRGIYQFKNIDARTLPGITREGIEGAVMMAIPGYGTDGPSIISPKDPDFQLLVDDLCDLVYRRCVVLNDGEESPEAQARLSKPDLHGGRDTFEMGS